MAAELNHQQYDVNGIKMHVAEQGDGPAVVLCHGFPELWYSWRHQLGPLAAAGFRVLAPDMRGYGQTEAPPNVEDYTQEQICGDMVALLDRLGLEQAVFVGHDWGGAVVWNMATHFPDRVRAVAGINTPFSQPAPVNPLKAMHDNPGRFDYQLYFQEPGLAEAEFERDIRRTFTLMLRSSKPADRLDALARTAGVRERGGLLVGMPDDATRSIMLTEEDLAYFAQQYERAGFRGGLNWYRNHERNWEWSKSPTGARQDGDGSPAAHTLAMPALMVTAGKDAVLTPDMADGMEEWIPNLSRGHIEDCGHWTQQEEPAELSRILVDWLTSLPTA